MGWCFVMAERAASFAVACVAVADLHPHLDPLSGEVRLDPRGLALSASDEAAVEHVLDLCTSGALLATGEKGARDEPVRPLVVAAGSHHLDAPLSGLAGLGVELLRVPWPLPGGSSEGAAFPRRVRTVGSDELATDELVTDELLTDELATDEQELAGAVAGVLRAVGEVRLVLCGDRSAQRGTGAFPAFLAHELGMAQALGLVSLEAGPLGRLRAERRLEAGRREVLEVPLPAVCSVEAAGVRLRRASLAGVLEASGRAVPTLTPARPARSARARIRVVGASPFVPRPKVAPPPVGTARQRLLGLTGALSEREPPTVLGPIGAEEAAGALLAYLARAGHRLSLAESSGPPPHEGPSTAPVGER